MKPRLTIARSLMNDPDLLLLDEPTTGLDPQARHDVWDRLFRLNKRGKTLVLTTHYMDEAEQLCDRVAVMDNGKIAAGIAGELIAQEFHARGGRAALSRSTSGRTTRGRASTASPSASRRSRTGCCSTPTTATPRPQRVHERGSAPAERARAPQHARGRVPAA